MSRQKRQSDDVYNARRRYRRQAERYLAKAEKSSGVQKARYEAQARAATISAIKTYGKGQKVQGQVAKLAGKLGIDKPVSASAVSARERSTLIERSYSALSGKAARTRDEMAREILSTGNIGSRFYGGLVQVWDYSEESRQHPNRAILEFFGKESLMDVLEELEARGIDLYAPDTNADVYKSVQLQLQMYVLNTKRIRNV